MRWCGRTPMRRAHQTRARCMRADRRSEARRLPSTCGWRISHFRWAAGCNAPSSRDSPLLLPASPRGVSVHVTCAGCDNAPAAESRVSRMWKRAEKGEKFSRRTPQAQQSARWPHLHVPVRVACPRLAVARVAPAATYARELRSFAEIDALGLRRRFPPAGFHAPFGGLRR